MAKKSLGQHFLSAPGVVADIITAAQIEHGETVLEIGPGRGVLTRALLDAGARVVAVEKDDALSAELHGVFRADISDGRLTIHNRDIMEIRPASVAGERYKVVANIPYNITGMLIRHLLSAEIQPACAVLMLQKEVALRASAKEGKESMLSISIKAYGAPHIVRTVKAGSFVPPPKVDSAVLAITDINRNAFHTVNENTFFTIVKNGFKEPRKQLKNNLESLASPDTVANSFEACAVPATARAENLTIKDWLCLTGSLVA